MGLTPNLTGPVGHYQRRTFPGSHYTICQTVALLVPSPAFTQMERRCDQQQVARSVSSEHPHVVVSPHEGSMEQQDAFFLPSMELITAVAQPTPDFTLSASKGQFREQAPHSMQASRSTILIFPLVRLRTAWGQTRRQVPQPVHFSRSSFRVTTSFRYTS
jgi:hypothetical protein